jgi:hypothetical protein
MKSKSNQIAEEAKLALNPESNTKAANYRGHGVMVDR